MPGAALRVHGGGEPIDAPLLGQHLGLEPVDESLPIVIRRRMKPQRLPNLGPMVLDRASFAAVLEVHLGGEIQLTSHMHDGG